MYAGQEKAVSHLPSLFDKDDVCWDGAETVDLSGFIAQLSALKKNPVFTDSTYHVEAVGENALVAYHEKDGKKAVGVFPLQGQTAFVPVDLPDGVYTDALTDGKVEVFRGGVQCFGKPIIILS